MNRAADESHRTRIAWTITARITTMMMRLVSQIATKAATWPTAGRKR